MNKLVLFDIDDTLVRRVGKNEPGMIRWQKAMKAVYGIDIDPLSHPPYDGWVDWQIGAELAGRYGVGLKLYEKYFPKLKNQLYQLALESSAVGGHIYEAIAGAKGLVQTITNLSHIQAGILTGNLEQVGWWKLEQAGMRSFFQLGFFSDDVRKRIDIAAQIFDKAEDFCHIRFRPDQVYIIGDTIHDIDCAKSIKARSIAYTAGRAGARKKLEKAGADLVVESMADKKIIEFID